MNVSAAGSESRIQMEQKPFFKENIDAIVPYEPGRPIEEVEREIRFGRVVKLASNENPLGPSRKALWAMRSALKRSHLYPDGSASELKARLAEEFGLTPGHFVVGNGTNEIIIACKSFHTNIISHQNCFRIQLFQILNCLR